MLTLKQVIESEAALSQHVESNDYEAIASWLNEKPLIANPLSEAPQIPKPLKSVDELFAIVMQSGHMEQDMTAIGALCNTLTYGKILSEFLPIPFIGDISGVVGLLQNVYQLHEDTAKAINARLAETIDDPSWQAQIEGPSRSQALGLSSGVTAEEVQEALNNAA